MYKHMWIERKLSEYELQRLCGALVHDTAFDQGLKPWQFVKPIPERRFKLGVVPQAPIIKLAKKEHVDAFFDTGSLQLGSFDYYNEFDHPEIGDNQEGIVTLVAKTPFGVIGGKYGSGYSQRMLCAFVGDIDLKTMRRFGYDSGFVITNPRGFSEAVATSIGATSSTFGRCLYRPHKAVLGFPGKTVNRHEISHRTAEIVNAGKHFIKPDRYSHQKEFRFLWDQPSDVTGAMIFDCSSARKYCIPLPQSWY
ncbi:hypothetical protein [Guyparkeria sp.]|uniref:hypothetical protein n=1 Tax=Guyparkeria sp. TaxID=2035736 RepID=UPI00356A2FC3